MDLKEEILSQYETYVTMKQPYNTTPIFLKENVLEAMERYAKAKIKQTTSEGKKIFDYGQIRRNLQSKY